MQERNISPPQDKRHRAPPCYANDVASLGGGAAVNPCSNLSNGGMQSGSGLDERRMLERAALWVESGAMWLPYQGCHVQVVAEAVVDVLVHPRPSQLVKHKDVPVTIISSAAQTAALAMASFRYACLECGGRWDFHKVPLRGSAFQHIVPIVKLQACRPGVPGADDLILEDIEEHIANSTQIQQVHKLRLVNAATDGNAHKDDRSNSVEGQRGAVHDGVLGSDQNTIFEATEQRTPKPIQARRC